MHVCKMPLECTVVMMCTGSLPGRAEGTFGDWVACQEYPYYGSNWVWLSGGAKTPDVVHRLGFTMVHDLCAVHSIGLQVFQDCFAQVL